MADDKPKHTHQSDDIIIKDSDGSYKILRDGKFVPLDQAEQALYQEKHEKKGDHGPKRAPDEQQKPVPDFTPKPQPKPAQPSMEPARKKALEMIDASGLTMPSMALKERLISILIPQIKGVRKSFQTKEVLMKAVDQGGAGLQASEAEALLGGSIESTTPEPVKTKMPPQEIIQEPAPVQIGKEVQAPPKIKASLPPPPPTQPQNPSPSMPRPAVSPKPSLADVQKPSRPLVGAASQLSYTLADWRRLAPQPADRLHKIENQLGVLESEGGFLQKQKGIQAWRSSEVFRLYLQAGKESLEQEKPLSEVLSAGDGSRLTYEEWKAIAVLNDRLRM